MKPKKLLLEKKSKMVNPQSETANHFTFPVSARTPLNDQLQLHFSKTDQNCFNTCMLLN